MSGMCNNTNEYVLLAPTAAHDYELLGVWPWGGSLGLPDAAYT